MPFTVIRKADGTATGAASSSAAPSRFTVVRAAAHRATPEGMLALANDSPGYRKAYAEAVHAIRNDDPRHPELGNDVGLSRIVSGAIPGMAEIHGAAGWLQGKFGRNAGYSADEGKRAFADAWRDQGRQYDKAHPIGSLALKAGGAAAGPGAVAGARYIAAAPRLVGALGRAAVVGGASGAMYGAADTEGGLKARAIGAAKGGALGAVTAPVVVGGALAGGAAVRKVVLPAGKRAMAALGETISAARRAGGHEVAPPPLTPAQQQLATDHARQFVRGIIASAGKTPADLAAHPAVAMGKPITAAEAIGRPGIYHLQTMGKRAGATADPLEGALIQRRMDTPNRLLGDISDSLNVHPEAARGNVEAVVEQGQAKVKPMFRAALGRYESLDHPDFEALATRPAIKKAMAGVVESLRNSGKDPQGLGFRDMENPAGWDSTVPTADVATSQAEAVAARAPKSAPRLGQGKSLVKFIADNGGIRDDGGEIAAMDGDLWHRGKAYQSKLVGNGDTADGHAMRAWEAGYFPELTERPDPGQLYDAVAAEFRGKPRFSQAPDQAAADRASMYDQADEVAYRSGVEGDAPSPSDYAGRPMPESDPVRITAPTPEAWDMVKKRLGQMVERDSITQKPLPDKVSPGNVDLNNASRAITAAMKKHVPGYADALDVSGDYLSAQDAFDRVKGALFNSRMPHADFAKMWAGFGEGDVPAAQAAIANDLHELAQNGRLKPQLFSTPAVRAKLNTAFGPDRVANLAARVEQEMNLLKGYRMQPGTNSTTGEGAFAGDEQANPDLLRNVVKGGVRHGAGGALGALADGLIEHAVVAPLSGARQPLSMAARDEAGRLLMMSPDELAQELTIAPPPMNPPLRVRGQGLVSPVAGTLAGALANYSQ